MFAFSVMLRVLAFVSLLFLSALPARSLPRHSITTILTDVRLSNQIQKLKDALNKRDIESLRAQISPSRIYVEIAQKPGAYLSNSQTAMVMESFIRTRSAISSVFDFITDDGETGSASGTLSATESGRQVSYRLNFGFILSSAGTWLLNRISMK